MAAAAPAAMAAASAMAAPTVTATAASAATGRAVDLCLSGACQTGMDKSKISGYGV